jgi:hypothetical protein
MLARAAAIICVSIGLSTTGCMTKLAAGTTVNVIAQASPAIQRYEDPELAEVGIPASIATMEGLLEIRPDDTRLREILARSYASFGFGFMEDHLVAALVDLDDKNGERFRKRAGMAY